MPVIRSAPERQPGFRLTATRDPDASLTLKPIVEAEPQRDR